MLAHPYWLLGMNTLYSVCYSQPQYAESSNSKQIFWFAGFVALAVYTNKGISEGQNLEKDPKKKEAGGCAVFFAGTGENEKACQMNKSAVGLGVFMWYVTIVLATFPGFASLPECFLTTTPGFFGSPPPLSPVTPVGTSISTAAHPSMITRTRRAVTPLFRRLKPLSLATFPALTTLM
jgi:hypothetical protein